MNITYTQNGDYLIPNSGMYVDLKEGLLSDAESSHHKEIVMEDIRAIERNLSELEAPKNQTEEQITGEMKWKQMIRRFHDATEISEEMADAFIETMMPVIVRSLRSMKTTVKGS